MYSQDDGMIPVLDCFELSEFEVRHTSCPVS